MKKIIFGLIPTFLLLTSCNKCEHSMIESFLLEARKGFTISILSEQEVIEASTEKHLFTNTTEYIYLFDNTDGNRVNQTMNYMEKGENKSLNVSFKRNDKGEVVQEYLNYKNEVDEHALLDESGRTQNYDLYFYNPFNFVFEEDLIQDQNNPNLYVLNELKNDKFEYFLASKGASTKQVQFLFNNDNKLEEMSIVSETLTGKAKDPTTGLYVLASWNYKDTCTFANIGNTTINSIETLKENEYKDEISQIFSKVNNNYTLDLSLSLKGEKPLEENTQVIYFDGNSCYLDNNKKEAGHNTNKLYQKDEFLENNLLYEYEFDGTNWNKTKNTSNSSYNILPKEVSAFYSNVKDISPNLFSKSVDNKTYLCESPEAISFIGNGFLSDFYQIPFFNYGFGLDASFTFDNLKNELSVSLPFYFVISGQLIEFEYNLVYSNLGSTTLPL